MEEHTSTPESKKFPKLALAVGALVIVAIIVGLLLAQPRPDNGPATPDQIIREAKNEPIPANARAIDAFVFADESDVYLKSVHSTSTTKIPQADPDTFVAVGEITQYGPQEVLDFCKGPGLYSFYKDKNKVYFFQAWKTETFAKTKIEVVKEIDADTFTTTGAGAFSDATHPSIGVGHEFATTTCAAVITGI